MQEYAGLFRRTPINASGMEFIHKCWHFSEPCIARSMVDYNTVQIVNNKGADAQACMHLCCLHVTQSNAFRQDPYFDCRIYLLSNSSISVMKALMRQCLRTGLFKHSVSRR